MFGMFGIESTGPVVLRYRCQWRLRAYMPVYKSFLTDFLEVKHRLHVCPPDIEAAGQSISCVEIQTAGNKKIIAGDYFLLSLMSRSLFSQV